MIAQEIRDGARIVIGLFHADAQGFQRAAEHPAGMRVELRADGTAQRLDLFHHGLRAERRTGDQIGMAADIFGQRVQGDVGAVLDRALENRSEQRVVAGDHRRVPLL
ncbi:hypothetical protein BLX88_00220, partial [Bacillus obstructivus]